MPFSFFSTAIPPHPLVPPSSSSLDAVVRSYTLFFCYLWVIPSFDEVAYRMCTMGVLMADVSGWKKGADRRSDTVEVRATSWPSNVNSRWEPVQLLECLRACDGRLSYNLQCLPRLVSVRLSDSGRIQAKDDQLRALNPFYGPRCSLLLPSSPCIDLEDHLHCSCSTISSRGRRRSWTGRGGFRVWLPILTGLCARDSSFSDTRKNSPLTPAYKQEQTGRSLQ